MKLVCPECKNEVNLSSYPNLAVGNIIECDVCGITLLVNEINGDTITCEVAERRPHRLLLNYFLGAQSIYHHYL